MSKLIGVYPGSFDPFHRGHAEIANKASTMFDELIIAIGINKDKVADTKIGIDKAEQITKFLDDGRFVLHCPVNIQVFPGLLRDFVKKVEATAIVKGLRDSNDFLYEQKQQYHNEDLGITIPTIYLVSGRDLVHVSSSAVRALKAFE